MEKFEDFLKEGKKIQIKRKYTENHPASTVGKTASVRNEVLKAVKDGVITEEEFSKIISKLSKSPNRWRSTNSKYFFVSEEGVKLSKWGLRILSEVEEAPKLKAFPVHEATVEMDAINPADKDFLKFLKKNKVTIINKEMEGPGGGTPVITMQGKRKDLETVLADSELGWDDPDLAEYIEESVVNEKFKITKDEWPSAVVKYKGKKYEIEFDEYDTIDDHGNEGKDLYFMGVDQEGGNWEVDVYADYRDEVQDVHWDTLIYKGIDESVTEAKNDGNLDTIADYVQQVLDDGKSFMDIGKKLKGAYKYDFSTGMMPMYIIPVSGNKIVIINKKYVENGQADRIVGDIAIGLMENIKTEITNMENTFLIHESFESFNGANGFLNEALGSSLLSSVLSSGKEGKYAKQNLKSLAGGFYQLAKVALDKVGDEDMIISNDPTKVFKEHGGSKHILFFISDTEKDNPYCPYDAGYGSLKTIPGGGTLIAAMSGDREFYTNDWSRYSQDRAFKKDGKKGKDDQVGVSHKYRGWSGTGLNNGKRIAEISDRVLVINLDLIRQKYSTEQLRAARAEAKSGAIAFTNDKDFKKANNDRYHQILATKAATMPLDKMVADAIDMLTDQIKAGLASGEKTRYEEIKIGQSAKGKEVKLRDASNHMSNILDDYSRYCDYVRQEEESEKRFGSSESWYKREIKNYALSLKEKIAKIEGFDYAW